MLLMHLTWILGWLTLGHPPQRNFYLESSESISFMVTVLRILTFSLAILYLFVLPANLFFSFATFLQRIRRRPLNAFFFLFVPAINWTLLFLLAKYDPKGIVNWVMDS
jgi:hypothetical protein